MWPITRLRWRADSRRSGSFRRLTAQARLIVSTANLVPFEKSPADSQQAASYALLEAAREGSDRQLGLLLQSYQNYLNILARAQIGRRLQSRLSPSDVVQETMLDAVRDFPNFRGATEREFLAWLRQMLIHNLHRCVELHVKAGKRNVRCEVSVDQLSRSVDLTAAGFDGLVAAQTGSPSAAAAQRETAVMISNQLARLPEQYREVIVLRNLQGLSFEQVAEEMQRSPGAVRMLWLRAIDRFRELIDAEMEHSRD